MKSLFQHFIWSIILALIILFPDIFYMWIEDNYLVISEKIFRELIAVIIISGLLLSIPSQKIKIGFFLFFSFLSFIELVHYAFFHGLLMHYEIMFFFTQFFEVKESVGGVLQYMYIPLILWIVQLILGYLVIVRSTPYTVKMKYTWLILSLLLVLIPYSAYKRHNISSMMPNNHSISLVNVYNSISLFIGKEIPKYLFGDKKTKKFAQYRITDINTTLPQNIIIVMGESLGYKYMHLFDSQMKNTPYLDRFKKDKNFIYRKGYASGVDTLTAVPSFFLLKREPQNTYLLGKNHTNLLSLARAKGYQVHYLTTQKLNIMAPYVSDANRVKRFKKKDEVLVDQLNRIDFSRKNFIVLHQRNSHSPYEDSTPEPFYKYPFKDKDFHTYMLNSYANSVLYTDYILNKAIEKIKSTPNSVIFMTSDHAELMGLSEEMGRYGHAFLHKEVAKVPMMIYTNNIDKTIKEHYASQQCFNHYTFGKLIANTLGYQVENPNDDGHYYIQGTAIDGSNGFIKYSEKECASLNEKRE